MNTSEVAITYVGEPTCVVEIGGVRFLTDPTFDPAGGGYTTGTVTLKKLRGPGLSEEEVGRFDYVLLTHDPTSTTLIVQAGRFCRRRKRCSQLAKARGGSSTDVQAPECGVLQIVATPARHGPVGLDPGAVCVLSFADSPESGDYVSGDTEVARWFNIQLALLHLGAARVPEPHARVTLNITGKKRRSKNKS